MIRAPAIALVLAATAARAEPLRLRADALATSQSPAGLLVLDGSSGTVGSTLSAEAIVWTAGEALPYQHAGDVLVIALRARTADGRAFGRFGRFVATLGALRPVQIDGAAGRVRVAEYDGEAYAGVPVQPGLMTSRTWDWVVGTRVARRLGDYGSAGLAYMEQRDDGRLATEELGFDAGYALDKQNDLGVRAAYDLANPGLAEITASTATRGKGWRGELYGSYRAASHILPATSLFTVLGDIPSERAGALMTWQAAPRLAVTGDLGARYVDAAFAPAIALRGRLALDARGAGAITGELRRDGAADDAWTGARGAVRVPINPQFTASSELELVIPDAARGRGAVWPWALVALGYDVGPWHAAVAAEASATPEDRRRLDVLLSVGRQWGVP